MQKEYLALGDDSVHNGQYLLVAVHLVPQKGHDLLDVATEFCAESSNGSNLRVGSATSFSDSMAALVYKVDKSQNIVWVAYPWRMFDRGGNVQNIVTFIAGNVFGMSSLKACKLLDIYFPSQMLVHYDGPAYTIYDMRRYLQNYHTPVFGTIIKPKIGLTPTEYAELCYDFWVGGGDFVKNDEPQANQDFCPFNKMVDSVRAAMDRAEDETGRTKVHSFNVSAADFDTMLKRADYVQEKMKPGSYAFLVDGITAGWMAVQTIRRRYPDVFLHFHRAGHGAFTRAENPIGFTVPVLTKLARLAGASGIHTGTAGVGKMSGTPTEDITAAKQALRLQAKGYHFLQPWCEIPVTDKDIAIKIDAEEKLWNDGARALSKKRLKEQAINHPAIDNGQWRSLQPTSPIVSGGLNPVLLSEFIEIAGTIDFITTMGGGVHSHPKGTQAGVKALKQAFDAWLEDAPLAKYAEQHQELAEAIEFYNKKGTQAHRVTKSEQA